MQQNVGDLYDFEQDWNAFGRNERKSHHVQIEMFLFLTDNEAIWVERHHKVSDYEMVAVGAADPYPSKIVKTSADESAGGDALTVRSPRDEQRFKTQTDASDSETKATRQFFISSLLKADVGQFIMRTH